MNINFDSDPRFSKMNPDKLNLLKQLASQASGKNKDTLIPFLLSANASAQKKGLQFTDEETKVLLDIFSEGMTPAERKRLELIRRMMKQMQSKGR